MKTILLLLSAICSLYKCQGVCHSSIRGFPFVEESLSLSGLLPQRRDSLMVNVYNGLSSSILTSIESSHPINVHGY
jgi:hypothetical protein